MAFNIDGVDRAQPVSADVVAKIFAGAITTWDDAAITALNPDATLSGPITVVHRSDDSGTSKNFQDYLSKTAPDVWTYEVSNTWPVARSARVPTAPPASSRRSSPPPAPSATRTRRPSADLGKVSLGVGTEFVAPTADAAAKTVDVSPAGRRARRR